MPDGVVIQPGQDVTMWDATPAMESGAAVPYEMKKAYEAIKTQGGGIAVSQDGKITAKIDLPIGGGLSTHPVSELIEIEKVLKDELAAHGFHHGDAIYTLLFLQATHLPYVRVTQRGIVDVLKKQVLFPSVMR